jgi:hypothetical protein
LSDLIDRSSSRLLLYCARAGAVDSGWVRSQAQEIINWSSLSDAADYHGLTAILLGLVDAACFDLVPKPVADRLRNSYRESARYNLILTSQMLKLLDAFQREGVSVIPLKGPVLAESLYADPALRPFSDLDFLIQKQDVPVVMRVLNQEGYSLEGYLASLSMRVLLKLQFELPFHRVQAAPVDIQWDIGSSDYPFRFDTEILWGSLGSVRIAGQDVPNLSREHLLLFLCVHGTKHMWSRLQWLGDVARLVRVQLDWDRALELAEETKCMRPLLLGALLAHELLDAPIPDRLLERARATQAVRSCARQVTQRLMRIPPVEPQGAEFTTFNSRMAERTWDKVRHYAALLKAPTDKELQLFLLPERLFLLYYPVRAARLALKLGRRLARR